MSSECVIMSCEPASPLLSLYSPVRDNYLFGYVGAASGYTGIALMSLKIVFVAHDVLT
jgi:hypothetical protein